MPRALCFPALLNQSGLLTGTGRFVAVHKKGDTRRVLELTEPLGQFLVVGMAREALEVVDLTTHLHLLAVDVHAGGPVEQRSAAGARALETVRCALKNRRT